MNQLVSVFPLQSEIPSMLGEYSAFKACIWYREADMTCIPACLYLEAGEEDLVFCWASEGHSKLWMPFLMQNKVTLF